MTRTRNTAASVKQRLLNLARERGDEFNVVLTRYGIERLLYRLYRSEHRDRFVLKGAILFHLWSETPHAAVFRAVCETVVEEDGLVLLPDSVRVERIREDSEYEGLRVNLLGRLGVARIPLQVDVGFGDVTVPAPDLAELPVLLGHPAPRLRVYRRETVIAEKLHAMVDLGMANSRMKDLYDLRFLQSAFAFDGIDLALAVEATFARRRTPVPLEVPVALTAEFAKDETKASQWMAFLRRSRLEAEDLALADVVADLREFLLPPLAALASGSTFERTWPPGGPWLARPSASSHDR
jgi:predicted nucleotidyltransferase component of viral defense system